MSTWTVEVHPNGRSGEVVYHEDGHVLRFYAELGGGDVQLIVTGPSQDEWDEAAPWVAGRRREIIERVGEELLRQEFPSRSFEVSDDDSTIIIRGPSRPRRRSIGHWLLFALAVVFFVEQVLFIAAALREARTTPPIALRHLVLSIGVFLSGVAALHGFVRRLRASVILLVALLLLQSPVSALAHIVSASRVEDLSRVLFSTIAGVVGVWAVILANRAQPR